MKNQILLINIVLMLMMVSCQISSPEQNENNVSDIDIKAQKRAIKKLDAPIRDIVNTIQWHGQASVKIIANKKVVYFDPFNVSAPDKADIIFITHSHGDHLSINDLKKILTEQTVIFAPKECCDKIKSSGINQCNEVLIGQNIEIEDLKVLVVPAYNTNKPHHPKSNNWVGYVLTTNGVNIYHPGDTDRIPEMKNIECDIAFMPLGQTYTMSDVEEAVSAVLDVQAKVAIPFHYGMYEGTLEDAFKFRKLLEGKVTVIIKEPETVK